MTGLEKIIAAILEQARSEAEASLAEAGTEAERIYEEEKIKSDALCAEITKNGKHQAAEIERACASSALLRRQKGVLEAKQAILSQTMEEALERLYTMPSDAYFRLLVKMAATMAEPGVGELLLNERDLSRRPEDFEKDIDAALKEGFGLRLSEKAQAIDGGFVLKYGDIEQNCSFRAIFAARRDEMSDRARGILFA